MAIQSLVPFISCVCGAADLEEALSQGFKEVYIMTTKGTFKHHQLRGENRFIRTKVDVIPGYTEPVVTEGMNFFPAGKIPYTIYEQVQAFFMKVMEMNSSEVEAMIHVLWNPERGYHLGVPPQTISKASVRYDWSYIPEGTSIIVDIHSHNTMGAFFSGTDDGDDRNNISFSGVFGKLKDPVPQTVWRFNYYAKKYTNISVADIFEASPATALTEELTGLLGNVKIQATPTYPSYPHGGFSNQGNVGRYPAGIGRGPSGKPYDTLTHSANPRSVPVNSPQRGIPNQNQSPNQGNQGTGNVSWQDMDMYDDFYLGGGQSTDFGYQTGGVADKGLSPSRAIAPATPGAVWRADSPVSGKNLSNVSQLPIPLSRDERAADDTLRALMQSEGGNISEEELAEIQQEMSDALKKQVGQVQHSTDTLVHVTDEVDEHYEALAVVHGVEVADAWWGIDKEMVVLEGKDNIIKELASDMVALMSEPGQVELLKKIFENLAPKEKEKIQTFGI